jgi:hypothetical protein
VCCFYCGVATCEPKAILDPVDWPGSDCEAKVGYGVQRGSDGCGLLYEFTG